MVEDGLAIIKEQDQTNLFLLDQQCSSAMKFLRAQKTGSTTVEAAVESAGPQDYICTEMIDLDRRTDKNMSDWIAELEKQQAHVRDLQTQPYPEWDFTVPQSLSATEMEKLELEVSGRREAIERDMPFYKKAVDLLALAGDVTQDKGVDAGRRVLIDGTRRLQEENMGAKDSPWNPIEDSKTIMGGRQALEEKVTEGTAEEEIDDSWALEDDWTDHSKFIEEDAGP